MTKKQIEKAKEICSKCIRYCGNGLTGKGYCLYCSGLNMRLVKAISDIKEIWNDCPYILEHVVNKDIDNA